MMLAYQAKNASTGSALLGVIIEIFFAVLPLMVLGAVWSYHQSPRDDSFWAGPEVSMTSCVLYGLTLARLLQGAVFAASKSKPELPATARDLGVRYVFLALVPLSGVIMSVIFIFTTMFHSILKRSVVNLVIAIIIFGLLAGHSLKTLEDGSPE